MRTQDSAYVGERMGLNQVRRPHWQSSVRGARFDGQPSHLDEPSDDVPDGEREVPTTKHVALRVPTDDHASPTFVCIKSLEFSLETLLFESRRAVAKKRAAERAKEASTDVSLLNGSQEHLKLPQRS